MVMLVITAQPLKTHLSKIRMETVMAMSVMTVRTMPQIG